MAKIGDLLVQKGLITPQQLKSALEESKKTGEIIGKTGMVAGPGSGGVRRGRHEGGLSGHRADCD